MSIYDIDDLYISAPTSSWDSRQKVVEPRLFETFSEITLDRYDISNEHIEQSLKMKAKKELLKQLEEYGLLYEYINEVPSDPYYRTFRCKVSLKAVPIDHSNYTQYESVFKHRGVSFTEEEIKKALEIAYPHKII